MVHNRYEGCTQQYTPFVHNGQQLTLLRQRLCNNACAISVSSASVNSTLPVLPPVCQLVQATTSSICATSNAWMNRLSFRRAIRQMGSQHRPAYRRAGLRQAVAPADLHRLATWRSAKPICSLCFLFLRPIPYTISIDNLHHFIEILECINLP